MNLKELYDYRHGRQFDRSRRIYFCMEYLFSKLKKLDVVSVTDGKNLGRLCDISLTLPEGKIKGFFATGCKGFRLTKTEAFIPLSDIVKVGEDTILVKSGKPHNDGKPCPADDKKDRDCGCPPARPPFPPDCPPHYQNDCPPARGHKDQCNGRADRPGRFDDYE